ncbi:MAG: hypothetical protein GY786_04245 [Proteobacteria bacterium]|nr:hypothetical protein [Pseudomonadota bacterium]
MSEFKNIFCIIKKTELDYYKETSGSYKNFQRLGEVLRGQIEDSYDNQIQFVKKFEKLVKGLSLQVTFIEEKDIDTISPLSDDLVISCGGDGTFLSCAQKFQNPILLGTNSDYKPKAGPGSFGALTSVNRMDLESKLKRLISGDYFIDHWNRLQAKINGVLLDQYAVNDIYFGQKLSYKTCNISVIQSGIEQDFNCSGILACTGMGSHAWYYNAGGSPFSNELDAFGFSALFPNLKRSAKFSSGIISSRHELIMIPQDENYILSFDSKSEVIDTHIGDEISVSLAPNKALRVVSFDV